MSKLDKELFISHLTGGSISEIYAVTTVSISSYLLYRVLNSNSLTTDIVLNCLCVLGSVTLYKDNIALLHGLILGPALLVWLLRKPPKRTSQPKSGRIPFLTAYRASMLILTNIAILAVDFPLFPRRFAKVETWGTSLMDMGVGSFVFSMGLVSAPKRSQSWVKLVVSSATKSLPLLALGVARCLSVKSLEYQEHVTEYGVHWNFFFTLGLLPIVLAVLDPVLRFSRPVVAMALLCMYEWLLQSWGMAYVLDSKRIGIVGMNKEGLFSFTGYLCIFVFGQSFAKRKGKGIIESTKKLFIYSVLYHILFALSLVRFQVSRRLANLPYVLWVVSFNASFLFMFSLVDQIKSNVSLGVFEAVNKNGLVVFLLGNLLTGLVNMSVNTLEMRDGMAFGILVGYVGVFVGLALYRHN